MKFSFVARSETGPVRKTNEDQFLVDADLGLFAVCDGMGGHRGGRRASELACETIQSALPDLAGSFPSSSELQERIEAVILLAHRRICDEADHNSSLAGMGTTCTMFLMSAPDLGIMAHVGDSRLYVLENGIVNQLSEDHSLVNELVKGGMISPEEALVHPQNNVIMRALGTTPDPLVSIEMIPINPEQTFLLCSDGLYRYFPKAGEFQSGLENPDLQAGVDSMVEKALADGGRDNITCLVFRLE
ncbi:MAG: protein phosphatase 2C domain-containing protein [Gemmatimonadales bacterium]|nr:protein phosphatase 2C domain-containing protein [Gemmatimonadales bacterium]